MRYDKGTFVVVPNRDVLRGLNPLAQVLFMWICSYADDNGRCFPSLSRLAEDAGMSRSTVVRRLEDLENAGLVTRVRRRKTTGLANDSNEYQIMIISEKKEAKGGKKGGVRETPPSVTQTPPSVRETPGVVSERHWGSVRETLELKPLTKSNRTKGENTPSNVARDFFLQGEKYHELREKLLTVAPEQIVDLELQKFCDYWTEPNKSGSKVRWELERTFEVERRLRTWLTNTARWTKEKQKAKGKQIV